MTLSPIQRASMAARLRIGRDAPSRDAGDGRALPGRTGPVTLNDGPADRPLVLFPAVGGTVHPYVHLARELQDDHRVCGLPAPPVEAGRDSLDVLVGHHLATLREHWPVGPYRLAGWSMGGILAFEITRRLEADGETVVGLGLLDTPFWLPVHADISERAFVGMFLTDAARSLGPVQYSRPDPTSTSVSDQLDWLASHLDAGGEPERLRPDLDERYAMFRTNTRILAGYRPSGSARAETLIIDVDESPNATSRWHSVLPETARTLRLEGNHYSFLQPPLVTHVAGGLRQLGVTSTAEGQQ